MVGRMYGYEYQKTDHGIKADVGTIQVEIQFYSPEIVRVVKYPQGKGGAKESISVVKTPEHPSVTVRNEDNGVLLESDSLNVRLDLQTGKITFADRRGNRLLEEKDYGTQFTPVEYGEDKTFLDRKSTRLNSSHLA